MPNTPASEVLSNANYSGTAMESACTNERTINCNSQIHRNGNGDVSTLTSILNCPEPVPVDANAINAGKSHQNLIDT